VSVQLADSTRPCAATRTAAYGGAARTFVCVEPRGHDRGPDATPHADLHRRCVWAGDQVVVHGPDVVEAFAVEVIRGLADGIEHVDRALRRAIIRKGARR
jgi:hypothetical protein